MRLIAKKPCSFGGRQFYIGDEVPENLVSDAKLQEKYGVITIVNDSEGGSGAQSGPFFTQEQVEMMITEEVERAEKDNEEKLAELQGHVAELQETAPGAYEETVQISVKGTADGENEQVTIVPAKPEEIQQVFSILQMNAEEGAKAIADVTSESVLILLHASDSRKTIKNAAKERADHLYSTNENSNESSTGNATTGTNTEGVDT